MIIVGGFFVWGNNQKQSEISEIVQNQNQNQNQQAETDISDWKTYKNEEYGFEVKYPQDWEYDLIDGVTFGDKKNCERSIIDNYWCENYISFIKSEKNPRVGNERFEKDVVDILNINNDVYNTKKELSDGSVFDEYYFTDDRSNIYEWIIVLKYDNKKENQAEITILREILKTFKLSD